MEPSERPIGPGNDDALVTHRLDGAVGVVHLNDPLRRNALSSALSDALGLAVTEVLAAGARAIVLTAAPPSFCSGGSLDELLTPQRPLEDLYAGFLSLADAPVPTIAAVGGAAVGAGVNLALACDVVLTSPAARFDPRFLDVGIHPGGGHLWRLRERVGHQGAAALVLCGDTLDGHEAVTAGLAWRCVAAEDLEERALKLARRAAARSAPLVRRTKATLVAASGLRDPDEAVAMELEAQRWSMAEPGFADGIRRIQAELAAPRRPR